MDDCWLLVSCHDQTCAVMLLQVAVKGGEPVVWHRVRFLWGLNFDAQLLRQRKSEIDDLAGPLRQSMISHRASDSRRAFDSIQSIHLCLVAAHVALLGEIVRIPDATCNILEKVTIHRANDIGLVEAVMWLNHISKGQLSALKNIVTPDCLILDPLSSGILLKQLL